MAHRRSGSSTYSGTVGRDSTLGSPQSAHVVSSVISWIQSCCSMFRLSSRAPSIEQRDDGLPQACGQTSKGLRPLYWTAGATTFYTATLTTSCD